MSTSGGMRGCVAILCTAVVAAAILTASPAAAEGDRSTASGSPMCTYFGAEIDCSNGFGTWSEHLQCWVKQMSTQPPADDPLWDGHIDGAIFRCQTPTVPGSLFAVSQAFWAPGPPAGEAREGMLARGPFAAMALKDPVAAMRAGMQAWMGAAGHLETRLCIPKRGPIAL